MYITQNKLYDFTKKNTIMRSGKKITNEYLRKKIQESLKNKPPISMSKMQILQKKTGNKTVVTQKKIHHSIENYHYERIKDSEHLQSIPSIITKINLPEQGSFNAGILDLGEKILCVYRPNEYEFISCFLDNDYKVINNFYHKFKMHGVTDPRLIKTPDNKVLMSYSKTFENYRTESIAGCIIMDLNKSDTQIIESKEIRITPKEVTSRQKNWMPFTYDNNLYFISGVCPHEIYEVYTGSVIKSQKKYVTAYQNNWFLKHGLRGNTNAVLLPDGNYLATFHTVARNKNLQYYDNGFYVFEGKPPFRVIYMSPKTYLKAEDAVEPHFRKAGLILCTFPVGMILRNNKILISYGDNDSCVKILEASLDDVLKSLEKINYE